MALQAMGLHKEFVNASGFIPASLMAIFFKSHTDKSRISHLISCMTRAHTRFFPEPYREAGWRRPHPTCSTFELQEQVLGLAGGGTHRSEEEDSLA